MRRLLPVVFAVLAVIPLTAAAPPAVGEANALTAHPRIFLTPSALTALRCRAGANAASWIALRNQCDAYLAGTVEWPNGNDYPDFGSIGEGYQGGGYFAAMANLGLCYQVVRTSNATKAAAYATKGKDVLTKMSAPYGAGQHGEDPLRDSGYGVFYGTGMALGFDWLFPMLGASLKTRVDTSLNSWLSTYASGGFEHDFPQGNYFAGYYAAKALAGLATEGDTVHGASWWSDWLNNVHNGMVQPYYAANLRGGGWPEGWNYGPLGVMNMSWPILAAKTAKGLDLAHAVGKPYAFPLTTPRYALYFTWPNQRTMEDSGLVYEGDDPTAVRASFFGDEAGLLEALGNSFAPVFHSFAQEVRAVAPPEEADPDTHLWEEFLFWNPNAAKTSYKALPLSYIARGMEMGAVRSSWNTDAVWGAFIGGPHSNFPDAGEEMPDKGSLAIVRGGRQLLVNSWGALLRNTPGTTDGSQYFSLVYDDVFGSPPDGNRSIFNVFYTNPTPTGQGYALRSQGARTAMQRFEDGGTYVAMRSLHLEDNYPHNPDQVKMTTSWTRDVVYLRPELFVVYDRTSVKNANTPRWMNFHLAQRAYAAAAPAPGVRRFDVGTGTTYAGTVETVLPAGHIATIAGLFGKHKIDRLTVRPGTAVNSNRWLTVFDPAVTPASAALASPLTQANGKVQLGAVLGVSLRAGSKAYAVLASAGGLLVSGEVKYVVPALQTRHVVTDLQPNTAYSVTASVAASNATVDVKPGSGFTTSKTGVLSFQTSATGVVSP
jgi:hypothetical protein